MICPSCQAQVASSQRFCPSCGASLATAAVPVADPLIGQTLSGKYRVTRKVGEGGMGAVYEGEQLLGTTTRRVAIKTLHPHLLNDATIGARFQREVGTIAELEHPNTIQVYDFGSTEQGVLYIVMEFLHGSSLADVLAAQGPMAAPRAQNIVAQACGSLAEAHARGIVHRDLKPDNIVLIERAGIKDFVKVLDFGIAKRSTQDDKNEQKLTQQGMVLGTPPYMSPEQFTGRTIDARSDIYSLGVMAYEMLTGQLPFKAETAWEWATQHMTQPPIPIESLPEGARLPPSVRAAIHRSLAKAPEQRFQTVSEFGDAFAGRGNEAMAAPALTGATPKAMTEIATRGEPAAGFGGAATGPTPQLGYTPAAGNVAFPTPGSIEQLEEAPDGTRKGRLVLLAVAGLIGIASVGAIAFAMRGGSAGPKEVQFDNGAAPAPATSIAPAATAGPETQTPVDPAAIPPLNAAGGPRPHVGPHVNASPGSSRPEPQSGRPEPSAAREPPTTSGPALGSSLPQPSALPSALPLPRADPPKTEPTTPAKYDGPECQRARTLRALGHPKAAEPWALACVAKGGAI